MWIRSERSLRMYLGSLGRGLAIITAMLMTFGSSVARAADRIEKYKQGQEVEVFFLNEWRPGIALDMNKKGEVLASYEFGNATQQRVFKQVEVRHKYESGAIARGRIWTDATGKFKIKAALLKISGNTVQLRSDEDKEIELSVDKLSEADKKFLEAFKKEAGVAALPVAERPELTVFDTSRSDRFGAELGIGRFGRREAAMPDTQLNLQADPLRSGMKLTQAGIAFPKIDFHDSMGTLLPLGGKDNWMLASIENNFGSRGLPVRLLWGALAKENIQKIQLIPPGEIVMDYWPAKQLLLTQSDPNLYRENTVLTVWKVGPSTDEAAPVVSWVARLQDDAHSRGADVWGRFASENIVVQRDASHRMIGWDLEARKVAWSMPQQSFFAPVPVLSPGGKYLFLPEDGGVQIVDPTTGNQIGSIPTANSCSSVVAHPDGRRLAVLARNDLLIVDITGAESTQTLQAAGIGTPFSRKMEWVNDDMIAVEMNFASTVLFSLKLQLPVWNYSFDHDAYSADARSGRTRSIIDGHLAYAASFQAGMNSGLVIGAVELPEPSVRDRIASVRREDMLVLRAGDRVAIDATKTDDPNRVRVALEQQVQDNGWIISPQSPAVLKAEMRRGDTQQVQYEIRSRTGSSSEIQTVTVTPYISSVQLVVDGEVAWSGSTATGVPPIVTIGLGQTVQSQVDQYQHPNIEFFGQVDIPNEIVDPKKTKGLGTSSVTNRGLVPAEG